MGHHDYKVVEVFGPTLQGEGPDVGMPTMFVRFGGCDYRCIWCDSMHAVDPAKIKAIQDTWSPEDIFYGLEERCKGFRSVVLSGGNPCIWDLQPLMDLLRIRWYVAVETQGTIFRPWLNQVDRIIVSPKPPSSGMNQDPEEVFQFVRKLTEEAQKRVVFKVVVFDTKDILYALNIGNFQSDTKLFISVGTKPTDSRDELLKRYENTWLILRNHLLPFKHASEIQILPQMHVLLWGHKQGV